MRSSRSGRLPRSLLTGATALLLVGCPTSSPYRSGYGMSPLGASPSPSALAGKAAPGEETISGVLYSEETGKPLSFAWISLDEKSDALTHANGSFSATRSIGAEAPILTALKSGYANLTIYGYRGGPLALPDRLPPADPATQSVELMISAPPGGASAAVVGVSVQREGYTYGEAWQTVDLSLSAAGTASLALSLPSGRATIIGYGVDGDVAGGIQEAVGATMSLSLVPSLAAQGYQADVPLLKPDGSMLAAASFYLNWPGETPVKSNAILVAQLTGSSVDTAVSLPPVDSFGIPGAYYSIHGADIESSGSARILASAWKRHVAPGRYPFSLLTAPTTTRYASGHESSHVEFRVPVDVPVNAADAYSLDLFRVPDVGSAEYRWRIVSLGTSTESLALPILSSTLFRSLYGLTVGETYWMRLGAFQEFGSSDRDEAHTYGSQGSVIYNAP